LRARRFGSSETRMFDFDRVIERRGTHASKWDNMARLSGIEAPDAIAMWVADMDFAAPPAVIAALRERVEHGIFGYARPVKSTVDAAVEMFRVRHAWEIRPEWIVWLPGLVVGLNVMARAFAAPGEEVLTLAPVYPPFLTAPSQGDRVPVAVPFAHDPGARAWRIDWDALERAVTPRTKQFFLCNPHNPMARVWRCEELMRLAEFCLRHDLVLCADEIHCDLILDPALRHICAGTLDPEIARRTITLTAPSKTYNIPGLGTSLAVIPDAALRQQFVRATAGIVAEVTTLGFAACEAAYRDGEPWRQALLAYLR